MSFKKSLGPEEKSVTSFEVNKSFTLTEADSGSGIYSVPLTKSSDSNLYNFDLKKQRELHLVLFQ